MPGDLTPVLRRQSLQTLQIPVFPVGHRSGFGLFLPSVDSFGEDKTTPQWHVDPPLVDQHMGYDFMLMPLVYRQSRSFPLPNDQVGEEECRGFLPWGTFRRWLIELGGRENGGPDSIWVEYTDGGSINYRGSAEGVYLDVHSGWENVLAAFREMLRCCADCSLFDLQSGDFHDVESFQAFAGQNGKQLK